MHMGYFILAIYLLTLVIAAKLAIYEKRKNTNAHGLSKKSYAVCLIGNLIVVVVFILFSHSMDDGSSTGSYIYYVNGVRTSGGAAALSNYLIFLLLTPAFAFITNLFAHIPVIAGAEKLKEKEKVKEGEFIKKIKS